MVALEIIFSAFAFAATSHAYVAALYSDDSCQNQIGERNVWDNTCAELGDLNLGSYKITTWGSSGQYARSYAADNCANWGDGEPDPISCVGAGPPDGALNVCVNAGVSDSTSHALGSSAGYC